MRPTRDENLMEMAWIASERGTCSRLQVGCIIAREGRVLVTGYNGAPAGMPHCNHECDCGQEEPGAILGRHLSGCNSTQPCKIAQHAEKNAIAFAARHGVAVNGAELLVTDAPCYECAMCVINAGITRVTFARPYRLTDGIDLLRQANVAVDQLDRDAVE